MKQSTVAALAAALVIVGAMGSSLQAQLVPATWDGGNGPWQSANWNGGQTAAAVFGDDRMSDGAFDVTIGGGSQVTYFISETEPTLNGFRPRSNAGPTRFTFKEGALWHHNTPSDGDADGEWTTWDADLVLDNATLRRTFTPGGNAQAGGLLLFGSWRSVQDQDIDISLTNGGKIENNGQIWFGADEEHAVGLKVSMIINNGSLDLTGGAFPTSNDDNIVSADWAMFIGRQLLEGDGTAGDGSPKGEEYEVNFRGPGTITVDNSGIWVYRQDMAGAWTASEHSYEQLWDEGLLKSKGMTGGFYDSAGVLTPTGLPFSNFFEVTSGSTATDNYTLARKNPTVVTWDGGAGEWNDNAKWNGGQTAIATMGANHAGGTMNRGSDGGEAIVLDGSKPGGANVSFDPNPTTGANTDFRMRVDEGVSSLTIKNGATFTINSASDVDGKFTRYGADLTIDGAGSIFRRTKDNVNSFSGGALMLGAFNQKFGQEIDVVLSNGGRLENDGELYFGGDGGENAAGLEVTITIDGGSMDLRGGDAIQGGFGFGNGSNSLEEAMNTDSGFFTTVPNISPSMMFMYTLRPGIDGEGPDGLAGEKYTINFTGPGSITVDHAGIYAITQDATSGLYTAAAKTYQQLWADGVLQANGVSGLDGASFSNFFTVAGAFGSDGYSLNSLLGGLAGDFDGDSDVDGDDFLVWQRSLGQAVSPGTGADGNGNGTVDAADLTVWRGGFGSVVAAGVANAGAVPEPTSLAVALVGLAGLGIGASRRGALSARRVM